MIVYIWHTFVSVNIYRLRQGSYTVNGLVKGPIYNYIKGISKRLAVDSTGVITGALLINDDLIPEVIRRAVRDDIMHLGALKKYPLFRNSTSSTS